MKVFFVGIMVLLMAGWAFSEEGFEYKAKDRRDPFVPLVSEGGAYISDAYGIRGIKDIRLEGIVWDETKGSVAIVNGEIVKEGQEIGVVRVLKIEKSAVIFEFDGEDVKIELVND